MMIGITHWAFLAISVCTFFAFMRKRVGPVGKIILALISLSSFAVWGKGHACFFPAEGLAVSPEAIFIISVALLWLRFFALKLFYLVSPGRFDRRKI